MTGGGAGVADAVKKAVVDAYYPGALSEADNARSRAQNGYTIAAAVAAAIVAAGVFGDVSKERAYVQGVGFAALVLWLAAAVFFISAVAGKAELPSAAAAGDADAFVHAVLERVRSERAAVERRLGFALVTTYIAVAITLAALALALAAPPPGHMVGGRLVLTKPGRATVGAICGGRPVAIAARTDPGALGGEFAHVELEGCGGKGKTVDTRLAENDIAAFAKSADTRP